MDNFTLYPKRTEAKYPVKEVQATSSSETETPCSIQSSYPIWPDSTVRPNGPTAEDPLTEVQASSSLEAETLQSIRDQYPVWSDVVDPILIRNKARFLSVWKVMLKDKLPLRNYILARNTMFRILREEAWELRQAKLANELRKLRLESGSPFVKGPMGDVLCKRSHKD